MTDFTINSMARDYQQSYLCQFLHSPRYNINFIQTNQRFTVHGPRNKKSCCSTVDNRNENSCQSQLAPKLFI